MKNLHKITSIAEASDTVSLLRSKVIDTPYDKAVVEYLSTIIAAVGDVLSNGH
jgi:hypothetical protein